MAPRSPPPLRFLSLNADSNHNLDPGVGAQTLRGILLAEFLLQADLVCLQECKWQEQNVLPNLQKGVPLESELKAVLQAWRCVSQTTAMATKTCILYNSNRLELVEEIDVPAEYAHVLAELGDEESGLPADSPEDRKRSKEVLNRCCAIVLQDKHAPHSKFVALSFHGHHSGVKDHKKCELFRLFIRLVAAITAAKQLPLVFGGDFNLHLKAFVKELQPAMSATGMRVYDTSAASGSKRPLKKLVDYIGLLWPAQAKDQPMLPASCSNVGLLQLPSSRPEAEQQWHQCTIQRLHEYDGTASKEQAESEARAGKNPQRHIIFWPALEQLLGPSGLFDHDGICAQLSVGHGSVFHEAPLLQPLVVAAAATAAAEPLAQKAKGKVAGGAGGRGRQLADADEAQAAPHMDVPVPKARAAAAARAPKQKAAVKGTAGVGTEQLPSSAAVVAGGGPQRRKGPAKAKAAVAAAEE